MKTSVRRCAVAAAVFLATFATYWPVRNHQFIFLDDPKYITQNSMISGGFTMEGLGWAFTSVHHASNWFPLTWISHMLDIQLFGLAPGGHHLTSVFLHALSAALLFWIMRASTGVSGRSLAVALLFSLHPLRVESVAWAAERKDVLSVFFWMLTLLAYLRWTRLPGMGRYCTALGAFALGLMSKPMLVTLPFVLLLLDFWPLGRLRLSARSSHGAQGPSGTSLRSLLVEKIPFLALSVATTLIALIAQGEAIQLVPPRSFTIKIFNAIHSYGAYLGKTFWPRDLMIFYPYSESWLDLRHALAVGFLLAAITVIAARAVRPRPYLITGWLWYVGTLFPVIGLRRKAGTRPWPIGSRTCPRLASW